MTSLSSVFQQTTSKPDDSHGETSEIPNNEDDDNTGYLVLTFDNNSQQNPSKINKIHQVRATTRLTARLANTSLPDSSITSSEIESTFDNDASPSSYSPGLPSSEGSLISSVKSVNHYKHYSEPKGTNSKMLKCIECGKYYRNQYSLHHHICLKRKDVWRKGDVPSRMIDGHLTYFCPVCYKPFKWLGNLTRHFYVHTGQRFFKCNMCDKEFFSAYQVKRHMNSHTGVRYKCEICERSFTCKYACAWHTRQHHTTSGGSASTTNSTNG